MHDFITARPQLIHRRPLEPLESAGRDPQFGLTGRHCPPSGIDKEQNAMNVTYTDPWRLVNRLHRDLDRLWGSAGPVAEDESSSVARWVPATDIREEDQQFVLHADLPGVVAENIDVTLDNGLLTIRGRRMLEERDEQHGYRRVERVSGEFFRRFSLPDTADSQSVKARHSNGVLEVIIPKQPQVMPRRISVESN